VSSSLSAFKSDLTGFLVLTPESLPLTFIAPHPCSKFLSLFRRSTNCAVPLFVSQFEFFGLKLFTQLVRNVYQSTHFGKLLFITDLFTSWVTISDSSHRTPFISICVMGVPFFLVPFMVRQFCTEPISFLDKALFHTSTACLAGPLNMLMSAIGDRERTEADFPQGTLSLPILKITESWIAKRRGLCDLSGNIKWTRRRERKTEKPKTCHAVSLSSSILPLRTR
jgi:hypothetical protein